MGGGVDTDRPRIPPRGLGPEGAAANVGQRLSGTLRGGQRERGGEVERWRDKGGVCVRAAAASGGGAQGEANTLLPLLRKRSAGLMDCGAALPPPQPSTLVFFTFTEDPLPFLFNILQPPIKRSPSRTDGAARWWWT